MHFHAVARAIFDRADLGELKLVELGSIAEQKVRLLRGAIPQEVAGRTVSALELNDPLAVIKVAAHDAEVAVIEACVSPRSQPRCRDRSRSIAVVQVRTIQPRSPGESD